MKSKLLGGVVLLFGSIFLIHNFAWGENTDIIINEIAAYEDSGHEWIEIYNKGEDPVDMTNWKFWEAETDHGLSLIQGDDWIIDPGEYAIITQNDVNFMADYENVTSTIFDSSWSTLNEGGEEIGLKDAEANFVEQLTYVPAPDYSLERKDPEDQNYSQENWVEHPDSNSVAEKNYWHIDDGEGPPQENQNPVAAINAPTQTQLNSEINFDGSSSYDLDGTIVSYDWDFGDGQTGSGINTIHIYNTIGTFQIILTVTDNGGANGTANSSIEIIEETQEPPAETANLLINEFVSDPNSGESEWVEIYNPTNSDINLTGWTLHDGVGKIASPTSTIKSLGFAVIELSASKLNNGGDLIILKNPAEEIKDQIAYGDWDDGNITDNAPAPSKGNSSARVDGSNNFYETTTPTKDSANEINPPESVEPPPSGGGGGENTPPSTTKTYNDGDLVINELVPDPTDGEEEFVELYNKRSEGILLNGWWIEDGSETKTVLNGSVSAKEFFVIEKPKGNLNNSGDIVILFDPTGKEIDRVAYGNWDDSNISDNAPAAKDPLSLARKTDGYDANNDYYDFVLTSTITKNSSNIISSVTEDGEVLEQIVGATSIIISEVFPNPKGSDNDDEFVELQNTGSETINLENWKLGDSSSKRYTIKQESIKAGQYLIFKRSTTGIALNNTGGDEVKLYSPSGTLVDEMKYPSAEEDQSYARNNDNVWSWTTKLTPGVKNIIEGKSAAPIISIDVDTEVAVNEPVLFDASDTTDPDGEDMSFNWNFDDGKEDGGDVVEHRFKEEGVYTVELIVVDKSKNESKKSVIVTVKNSADFVGDYLKMDDVEKIQISEFLPNPEGSDTTEFIELFNPTNEDIDLSGLKLDDEEGGSRAYTIPENTIIPAQSYLVIGRQDSKLALNNTTDSVRLLYPDGTIIKEIRFDDVLEGHSYIQDENDNWIWSSSITPGEANIISAPKAVAGKKVSKSKSKSKSIKPVIETSLEKIRDEDIGDMVKVTGVVAVEPGKLATQYFYIVGSPGVQVYMYKKDFPKLAVGDRVEVTGEISEISGETRLKTSEKSDIQIIDHPGDPPAKEIEVADIGEPFEGWLTKINGEITEIKSSYMYVDDGTEEVKVYFKRGTGIDKKLLQLGDIVSVTGIVNQTKSGFQLLPRFQADIVKTGITESAVEKQEQTEEKVGKEVAEKYLTATAGGLTSVLVGLFAHSRGPALWRRGKEKFLKIVKRRKK